MSIEVHNLLKLYGEQKAVNHISFQANRGEIVGFLGPNGAGKSTTMKIITGYLSPTAGDVRVCGIPVKEEPLAARKKIGYLPEQNALYYDMYVREYLHFIAGLHHLKAPSSSVESVIAMVGLQPESGKKIGQLSKGYKQRVGLAAALVHDPEVLVLDEPTSGLDPNQITEIRDVIRQQGINKTVLFSSHILQEVEAICNRIIIINKGELVADDTLAHLQKRESGQVVTVQFGETVNPAILAQLPQVTRVTEGNKGMYNLHTGDADMLRKHLLQLALEHSWNILSLQTEKESLENIFRSLTHKD